MEDNDEEQADFVEQVFDMDYNVAQAFCSHIIPKALLLFTGEALDDGMEFEPDDGEGDDDDDKGVYVKGGGGMGLSFPDLAKTTSE